MTDYTIIMKQNNEITRTYLESLSTPDLIMLADDYGLDIPNSLPRQIIIGEILSDAQISHKTQHSDPAVYAPEDAFAFNRYSISFLLRNPGWGYTCWTLREAEKEALMQRPEFGGFFLRVTSIASAENGGGQSFYDITVSADDKSWYIYLDTSMYSYRISICCLMNKVAEVLAESREVLIPRSSLRFIDNPNVNDESPLMRLSGVEAAYKLQFRQHRQTFQ